MTMIRVLFVKLLDDKRFNENRKITINEVAEETGIGRATLTRIANQQGYAVGTNIIDKLCDYFDCDVSDILQRVPDNNDIKSISGAG
jgi:putative transcriptional regulator